MWNDKWSVEGLSLLGPANLDLGTLMAESMAATVVGAGISAAGTPAGGSYAMDCRADAEDGRVCKGRRAGIRGRPDRAERRAGSRLGPAHRIRNTAAHGAATGNGWLAAKLVGGHRAVCAFRSVPRDDGDNTYSRRQNFVALRA